MDQISDKKNKEDNWIENIALKEALKKLDDREQHIVAMRFLQRKTQMEVAENRYFSSAGQSSGKYALKTMRNYLRP